MRWTILALLEQVHQLSEFFETLACSASTAIAWSRRWRRSTSPRLSATKRGLRRAAANKLRKLLSLLMRVAILEGWRKDNPCLAVKGVKIKSKGHRTWTDEEIAAFEAFYPIGTEARLAFALLLYTGQRRSDVVRMGRQHVKDGVLTITQKKGGDVGLNPDPAATASRSR